MAQNESTIVAYGSARKVRELRFAVAQQEYLRFRVLLTREADETYSAEVPALPGVATQGTSEEDALKMATEAIEMALEAYERLGQKPPIREDVGTSEHDLALRDAVSRWTLARVRRA